MIHRVVSTLLIGGLCVSSVSGCASTLRPRTSAELQYKEYKKLGAVIDASRAYPLAFYAAPSEAPKVVEVKLGLSGAHVQTAQWLTHLAARMNQALHEVGLYDRRFAQFAHRVFHNTLSSGDYVYDFDAPGAVVKDIELSGARLAKLKLTSLKVVKVGADEAVRATVEVLIGGLPRMYQAEGSGSNWDQRCFDGLARKILSDSGFWKSVSRTP